MIGALSSSLSGMRSTQTLLDVTANNLANSTTTGFKASRVEFADQFYQMVESPQGPGSATGGVNPSQVGAGVQVQSVDVQMNQGPVNGTGRALDAAITGSGFFRLQTPDGGEIYTRLGNFGFDAGSAGSAPVLVDLGTGFRVTSSTGTTIQRVDSIPPAATTSLELSGNLPPAVSSPLHGTTLGGLFPITVNADGSNATSSTPLAQTSLATGIPGATTLTVFGSKPDGSDFTASVPLAAGATVGDLLSGLNAALTDASGPFASASLSNGSLSVTALSTGSDLSVFLGESSAPAQPADNATANAWQHAAGGVYDWNRTRLSPTDSTVATTLSLYTADGTKHELEARFVNVGSDAANGRIWDLVVGQPASGTGSLVGNGVVQGYLFNSNGTLATAPAGTLDTTWAAGGASSVALTTGSLTGWDADGYMDSTDYTGYGAGTLLSTAIDSDGWIVGSYSNGKSQAMSVDSQLGMAVFANAGGLVAAGDSLWQASENSGAAAYVAPGTGGDNVITGGAQEGANVDLAGEYTRLIIAQRSFQSNSKAFQVASEMLQDANGLVR